MADDDDEDDFSEEEEEEEAPKQGVTLKGELSVTENRLFWEGKWGLGEEETSKFKYGGPEGDVITPPNGLWHGYFMNPTDEGNTKVREKSMRLTFDATDDADVFVVTGEGTNDFGDFQMNGSYVVSTRRLECSKSYTGAADDDDDDIEEDAFDANYDDELAGLKEEQDMPLEELAKRYGHYGDLPPQKKKKKGN